MVGTTPRFGFGTLALRVSYLLFVKLRGGPDRSGGAWLARAGLTSKDGLVRAGDYRSGALEVECRKKCHCL